MAIPVIIARAAPTIIRAATNPKAFKRFLGTRAGKKATIKYGTMLVRSKDVRSAIEKMVNRKPKQEKTDKSYEKMLAKYERLIQDIEKIQADVAASGDDTNRVQQLSFALGRRVVEMRRLYSEMQRYQQSQLQQNRAASMAYTR